MGYGSQDNNTPSASEDNDHTTGEAHTGSDPGPRPEIPSTLPPAGAMPRPSLTPISLATMGQGGAHPAGATVVNTKALTTFAGNLKSLDPLIRKALTGVQGVNIRAGGFHAASELASAVQGDGKLRDSVQTTLSSALDALAEIGRACVKIAQRYDTTEELNAATAQGLHGDISLAESTINGLGGRS